MFSDQILTYTKDCTIVAAKKQHLDDGFLNQFWVFHNWFSDLIRFKVVTDLVSSSKRNMGNPWHTVAKQLLYHG